MEFSLVVVIIRNAITKKVKNNLIDNKLLSFFINKSIKRVYTPNYSIINMAGILFKDNKKILALNSTLRLKT